MGYCKNKMLEIAKTNGINNCIKLQSKEDCFIFFSKSSKEVLPITMNKFETHWDFKFDEHDVCIKLLKYKDPQGFFVGQISGYWLENLDDEEHGLYEVPMDMHAIKKVFAAKHLFLA